MCLHSSNGFFGVGAGVGGGGVRNLNTCTHLSPTVLFVPDYAVITLNISYAAPLIHLPLHGYIL